MTKANIPVNPNHWRNTKATTQQADWVDGKTDETPVNIAKLKVKISDLESRLEIMEQENREMRQAVKDLMGQIESTSEMRLRIKELLSERG